MKAFIDTRFIHIPLSSTLGGLTLFVIGAVGFTLYRSHALQPDDN